ncbi:MAG: methionyl-tRNA formyltransferase [Bacteroidetes bacterium]|nr:methionyl-tRNA formyltransferase [Bacteroidota bacterium]MBK9412876.1 methionyl-tRNA formyltransferase [Bacteroidota bacterium]
MSNKPKIVFLGTPEFAVPALAILVENGYPISAVVTVPDKPAGRGQKILSSPVKQYAETHGLKILQPSNLKDETFVNELKSLNADLQIVVAFRMLPEVVWNMPRLGTFNLHGSLLPQYRGAAPINWAIINGEKTTGVTTFFLKQEIDTGNIIFKQEVEIGDDDNAESIHDKLMHVGSQLVLKTVQAIESGKIKSVDQSTLSNVTLNNAPKLNRENIRLSLSKSPEALRNFIRGLSPYPAAHTEFFNDNGIGFSVKIFDVDAVSEIHEFANGKILTDNKSYLRIYLSGGYVSVNELQLSGRNKMKIKDFLNGVKFEGNWKAH